MVCHDICVVFFFNTIIDLEPGYALVIQKPPFPQRATATLRTWIFFFFFDDDFDKCLKCISDLTTTLQQLCDVTAAVNRNPRKISATIVYLLLQ